MREQSPQAAAAIDAAVAAARARDTAARNYLFAVVAAKRAGASQVAIARGLGISSEAVRQILARHG